MTTHRYEGGCHCGNITFAMEMTIDPGACTPRACDCDFCTRHGAAYVSDPEGKLEIGIRNEKDLSRYRQGSGSAEMLVCRNCGVMVAACYVEQASVYATVNCLAVAGRERFGPKEAVSPKQWDAQTKIRRWKRLWFKDVRIHAGPASPA